MINFQRKLQRIWGLGAHLEIMVEGERKLCLVGVLLELMEDTPLQVQMQLMEEMEHKEALEAGEEAEALVEVVPPSLILQQEMEVLAELEVMGAAAGEDTMEGWLILALPEQGEEVQEVLVVLEEEAEEVELLDGLQVVQHFIVPVMVQQEAMAEEEVEEEDTIVKAQVLVAAALVALD